MPSQSLAARLRGRAEVWLLAQRHNSVALSLTLIVVGGSVEDRAVVPDGKIIVVPSEANLQVVVLADQLIEVAFDELALSLGDIVDPACVNLMSSTEQALPASHRVSANDRVRSGEVQSSILWGTSVLFDELKVVLCSNFVEVWLMMSSCQAVGKSLPNWGQPVISFIT